MRRKPDRVRMLVLGEDRRLTMAAVVVAGVLFLTAMVVDYITLLSEIAGRDPGIFGHLRMTFQLVDFFDPPMNSATWVYGYILVAGLAGVHAYFNLGYLSSLLLALSPNIGTALWSIHGFDEYMVMTPMLIPGRVFPEGPIVATLGFLVGAAIRFNHNPPPAPDSPQSD